MKLTSIFWMVLLVLGLFFGLIYFNTWPFRDLMNWKVKREVSMGKAQGMSLLGNNMQLNAENTWELTLTAKAGQHFWHPQVAVWIEDKHGNFLETLMVTNATAKGWFYGGRTRDNFKSFDAQSVGDGANYRRVDALPVWSHSRGVRYQDGLFVPPANQPLPDGMSGATPSTDFTVNQPIKNLPDHFSVFLEMNVAFDENEYFSEYDYPDDEVYHNGTGQLGQPSIVYRADFEEGTGSAQMMKLIGHGHHSAKHGDINPDLSTLTTALHILDWVVVERKEVY
ncbi:MAG: hypothetical protein ACPGJS_10205 [Flammeovirgaceae bacterium]